MIEEFQTSSIINISTKTVCWERHGISFHGQTAPGGVIFTWPSTFVHIVYLDLHTQKSIARILLSLDNNKDAASPVHTTKNNSIRPLALRCNLHWRLIIQAHLVLQSNIDLLHPSLPHLRLGAFSCLFLCYLSSDPLLLTDWKVERLNHVTQQEGLGALLILWTIQSCCVGYSFKTFVDICT